MWPQRWPCLQGCDVDSFNVGNPLQGTGEWLNARVGSLTASRMADAMRFRKDGKPSAERTTYMRELLAERLTGNAMSHVTTQAMKDGRDREPYAREQYEATTGNLVTLVGFIAHPTIAHAGASPDGLLAPDGLIEIKAPTETTHIEWMLSGVVPEAHKAQMTFQAACTRRRWIDFVSYHPAMPEKRQLFIRRYEPTPEEIEVVEVAARQFLAELEAMFTAFVEAA